MKAQYASVYRIVLGSRLWVVERRLPSSVALIALSWKKIFSRRGFDRHTADPCRYLSSDAITL